MLVQELGSETGILARADPSQKSLKNAGSKFTRCTKHECTNLWVRRPPRKYPLRLLSSSFRMEVEFS